MKNFWKARAKCEIGTIVREMDRNNFGMTIKFYEVDTSSGDVKKGVYLSKSQFLYKNPSVGDVVRVFKDGDGRVAEKL